MIEKEKNGAVRDFLEKNFLHILYYLYSVYATNNVMFARNNGDYKDKISLIFGVLSVTIFFLAKLNIKRKVLRYVFVSLHFILFMALIQYSGFGVKELRGNTFNMLLLYSYLLPNPFTTYIFLGLFYIKYASFYGTVSFTVFRGLFAGATTTTTGFVTVWFFVRKLNLEKENFKRLSITDSLTGTFNLNHIIKLGNELLEKKKDITLVMLDLNNFKQLNDNFGHMTGNVILKDISRLLMKKTEDYQGIIGRIGGDEFVILLQDENHVDVKAFVEYLYENIHKQTFEVDPDLEKIHLSFAFGIVCSKDRHPSEGMEKLLNQADINMYYNKYQSKNNEVNLDYTRFFLPDQVLQYLNVMAEKDMYTYVHSEHVAKLSANLALQIGLPMEKVAQVYIAGWIHDIGKSLIPNKILRKSVTLEDDEYTMIKEHIDIGINIVRRINISESIENGMKYHHENFDGTGYPFTKTGVEIPIEGRILRIVDAYSAMTIKRVYRETLSKEEALQEIIRHKGIQFDPTLVDAFEKMLHNEQKSGIIEKVNDWIKKMHYKLTLKDTVEFQNAT